MAHIGHDELVAWKISASGTAEVFVTDVLAVYLQEHILQF
jgi:hypothetical protein